MTLPVLETPRLTLRPVTAHLLRTEWSEPC
jgi:hypothetical protein